jgi:hypothetical protein
MVVGGLLNAADHLAGEGIGDCCHNESNRPRLPGNQPAGDGAGSVSRILCNFADSFGGLGIHQGAELESAGHSGMGYLSEPGNVFDGRLV